MDILDPKQKVKEVQEKIELYLISDTFLELFNETKKFISKSDFLEGKELIDEVTSDEVRNVIALEIIEEVVISPLIPVHIFIDQPFKCLKWIKGILKNLDYEFALFILSCIKLILNDKRRFQQKRNHLDLIKTDLEKFDYHKCEDSPIHYKSGWIEFFTGQNSFKGFSEYCHAIVSVKGFLKTEEEIEIDLINQLHALKSKRLLNQKEKSSEELYTGWVGNKVINNEQSSAPQIKFSNDSKLIYEKTRSEEIKENLVKYKFYEYLKSNKKLIPIQINKIEELIINNDIPFIIALFNEIGFIDYFKKEFCFNKATNRDEILGKLLNVNKRRIKGNINVLNANSKECRITYTAHQHKENIKNIVKGL